MYAAPSFLTVSTESAWKLRIFGAATYSKLFSYKKLPTKDQTDDAIYIGKDGLAA